MYIYIILLLNEFKKIYIYLMSAKYCLVKNKKEIINK